MKNLGFNVKQKLLKKYLVKDSPKNTPKSTNINILLNRVKSDQRRESMKKLYFSAAASTGLVLFGFFIF